MKKIVFMPVICLLVLFLVPSCIKDTVTKTYTIYRPVYKTKAEVMANMKTNHPITIKNTGKFFLYGKYIFLNEIDKGIHVIDNNNPAKPKAVGFINIPGNVDLAIRDNILYADFYRDLVTIDVTNPLQAKVKKVIKNAFPQRQYFNNSAFAADSTNIIVDWTKKDTTVDANLTIGQVWGCIACNRGALMFSSMDKASSLALVPAAIAGSMARFAVVNTHLYTVDNNDLNVFSVSIPEEPVFSKKVFIGFGVETMYPFKDKLFIGSNLGMFIYDISNGGAPVKMGQFSHARVCDPVVADDEYAYVTLRNGTNCNITANLNQLDVINVSNLNAPFLVRSYAMTNPHGLSKDGKLLFICDGKDGLKIFDASDVTNLKLIKHFKGFESFDVIAYNNIAMVVEKSGIRQFDYSNPADIKYLSTISW